ncbi:hypothetical protein E2A64_10230 [Pseudohoeflea suaedae]|uniref:Uncharacterized protein n=1 Tax=Pseudohoeflea suaedae TaxID=877384 RepID=A0A4R5PKR1_9HYPH|nr:hypothetical protein E2A64_10230 [Pseudohoeflea suaedae]
MGYQCYEHNGRDQGYGVPAICDHPGCNERIHRGVSYACGGDPMENCGLFFCGKHRANYPDDASLGVCERCAIPARPFKRKPDIPEWTDWKLNDPSWAEWRAANPEWVKSARASRNGGEE